MVMGVVKTVRWYHLSPCLVGAFLVQCIIYSDAFEIILCLVADLRSLLALSR